MAAGWSDPRPLSPHLGVWKWHVTMAGSILHRMTVFANYAGLIILAVWLCALAMGPAAFANVNGLLWSAPGKFILVGLTASTVYFLLSAIRHLIWDAGKGFELGAANMLTWLSFVATILVTAALWGWLLLG